MFQVLSSIIQSLAAFFISLAVAIGLFVPSQTEFTEEITQNPGDISQSEKDISTPIIESPVAIIPKSKEPLPTTKTEAPTNSTLPKVTDILSSLSITTQPAGIVNTNVREALVNILCTTKSSGIVKPITASGVVIDPRGVILTNAHAAQYMLLKDFQTKDFVECVIRTGAPAYPKYKAQLLFISPEWIQKNYENITEANPLGTGENDYALLLITEATGNDSLPKNFPFVKVEIEDRAIEAFKDIGHLIAGYPAGFLGGITVVKELYPVSTVATIRELFTFKESTVDLVSLGGTIVSQKGSSGGAVVNQHTEKLVGIIVTTSDGETTAERDLRAVTVSHINRSIKQSTGMSLEEYVSGDLKIKSQNFLKDKAPALTDLLIKAISEN